MFQSILAATDRITGRDPVVISAARLANALKVPWSIIHVLESASLGNRQRMLHFHTGQDQDATARYRADVRHRLRQSYRDLLAWAPPCEVIIAAGFPWKEIGRQAALGASDLIIMGPHADISNNRAALQVRERIGSTVEGILTRKHCPVLIVNQYPCRPKPAFKRILVGIDFSASCERAFKFAVALARFYHTHIDLFHMLPVPPYPKYTRDDYDTDRKTTLDRMASFCGSDLGDIPHRFHCWGGALPYRELLKCAAKCQTDAIVMGSHTTERQGKWYAGSTVEKISLQAPCPVFVLTASCALQSWTTSRSLEEQPASTRDHAIHVFGKKLAEGAH